LIIVTGASRGIGQAIKNSLEQDGHEVIGLATKENRKESILKVDVSDYSSIKSVRTHLKKQKKEVEALINVAGIASMNLALATPEATSRKIIETNLLGTIFTNQIFAPMIIKSGGGRIINFSTIAVKIGLEGESIYIASKAGVEGFTRSFAKEVSGFNITVNCIAPGPIKTDLLKGITEKQIQKIIEQQAFKKIFKSIDVVNTVKTLLSKESENITGQVIHIGGV
jgi:3-oxoacyl-[acyl-carrier protein] reductase